MAVRVHGVLDFVVYSVQSVSFRWVAIYLLMIALGRRWTRHSTPLKLNTFLVLYNYGVAAANLVCFWLMVACVWRASGLFDKNDAADVQYAAYLYWTLKLVELADTAFMILRHKLSQISVLHVYHHTSMVLLTDYYRHLAPWPAITVPAAINAAIHTLLYIYYGACVNGSVSFVWKKRLTQLQIAQFVCGLVHSTIGYLHHRFCVYSVLYALSMIGLFSNFYFNAYVASRRSKSRA